MLTLQNNITLELQQKFVGNTEEVLIIERHGKKDENDNRLTGYTKTGHLVHIDDNGKIKPGDFVDVKITYAAPFHLIGNVE